jgi:S1-C subfamily serine protease
VISREEAALQGSARPKLPPLAWLGVFLLISLVAGAASGAVVATVLDDSNDGPDGSSSGFAQTNSNGEQNPIVQVAAAAMPSVVTIVNEGPPRQDEQGNTVETISSGSGVIVDARGFIVTNEHVIRQEGTLSVVLNNGDVRPAAVVSHDAPFTDLAVIRIPEGGLKALPVGDSSALVVGQTVLAIGSALFEYSNSVTTGVVSGLGRRYLREGIYMEDLIQTDAAVNTGNSGGPLVTLDGKVVGVVANVVRRIAGIENIQGISFSISSRTLVPVVESIIRTGSYPRPYAGIDHVDLDFLSAQQAGLPVAQGALVQRVISGSPAQEAGIQAGDVILGLGRSEVNEDFTFLNALALVGASDRVPVQVLRGSQVMNLALQLVPR